MTKLDFSLLGLFIVQATIQVLTFMDLRKLFLKDSFGFVLPKCIPSSMCWPTGLYSGSSIIFSDKISPN